MDKHPNGALEIAPSKKQPYESGSMSNLGKKLRFALLYVIYLIVFVLAVAYIVFWRPFVKELRKAERKHELITSDYIDLTTIKRLGSVRAEKKSSFVNFKQIKDPGIVRVCAFGDSFTYGDEVSAACDFPSLLQKNFDKKNFDNVEVINFGNAWYGFHQAYLMWDGVGRNFDCDYILLGPACFQEQRDTTFNHTDLVEPYFFHSRYILDGGGLQRVDVLGDTAQERFDRYFRFIPSWRYLRYDRYPPPILRSILPRGRTVENGFYYYSGSMREEAHETYKLLLDLLSREGIQMVLASKSNGIVALGKQVNKKNLAVTKVYTTRRFPYAAPKDHFSAWGNALVAQQFYQQLFDSNPAKITFLTTRDVQANVKKSTHNASKPALSSYDQIDVLLDDIPIGYFVIVSRNFAEKGVGSPDYLRTTEIVSFLGIKNGDDSVVDACFVPLNFEVHSGDELSIERSDSKEAGRYLLGRVRLVDERLNIGMVDVDGVQFAELAELHFDGNESVPVEPLTEKETKYTISLNNNPILKVLPQEKKRVKLKSIMEKLRRIRVGTANYVDVDTLQPTGTFYLSLRHPEQGLIKTPVASWTKSFLDSPTKERAVQKVLSMSDNHKVVMREQISRDN